LRTYVARLHRWTGLAVGPLIVLMAVTGIGMVLRPQLEPMIYRDLMIVPPCTARLALDDLAAKAREVHPTGVITHAWIMGANDRSTMLRFDDNASVYLDPCSGAVLGQQHRYGGLFGGLERLHKWAYLDGDKPLHLVPGAFALLLALVMTVGGIVVWRPRRWRAWKSAAKFRPHLSGLAFTRNLHTSAGLYAGLIVFIVAATGVPQAFDWAENAIRWIAGSATAAMPRASSSRADAKHISLETAWQRVRALVPDPTLSVIHIATRPGAPVDVYLIGRDAPHAEARSYVYLDGSSGEVLDFRPYAAASPGQKLVYWFAALHKGQIGGLPTQLLLLVGMLGIPVLGYTGIESYLRKRIGRRGTGLPHRPMQPQRGSLEGP
jgi:vanillate O-demethylase ferredoxin subunit